MTSGSQDDSPWYEAHACAVAALTVSPISISKARSKANALAHPGGDGARDVQPMPSPDIVDESDREQIRSSRSRLRVGFEKGRHFAQGRTLGRRPEQAQLPGESPSGPDRLRHAFVEPPRQRATAGARRQRQVDDLVTHDGLE